MQKRDLIQRALTGDSIIDSTRLSFTDSNEVKQFLKINEFQIDEPKDVDRLMGIHNEAVDYMTNHLGLKLPEELLRADKIQELFLSAATNRSACALLKVMNTINHIDGRELLFNCPISTRDLFNIAQDKIERELSSIARKVVPGIHHEGGRKSKESLVTKLLTKRQTLAAHVSDRVRYRIITPQREEIPKVIVHLFETILPFNYIIPGTSVNQLIPQSEILDWKKRFSQFGHRKIQNWSEAVLNLFPYPLGEKEHSGKGYRVVRFTVDVPVRLERFLNATQRVYRNESLGCLGYVLVEFQIVDQATQRQNDLGENEHALYKKRQKKGVVRRLLKS